MLERIIQNPKTSALGIVPGGALVEDGIRQVAERPDDISAWARLVIGLVSILAGIFLRDPDPKAAR